MWTGARIRLAALFLGLASVATASPGSEVQVHGALRAMLHDGQTQAVVTLDAVLSGPATVALGALADLAGEITVLDGRAYLSYPAPNGTVRTVVTDVSSAGASLLVSAQIPEWTTVTVERTIPFAGLDDSIAKLAAQAGIGLDARFPFRLEGEFEDLQWHVIDGRRLEEGKATHEDHLAAAVKIRAPRARGTLLGFYSATDQGVFTHMGSRTHLHSVVPDPLSSGHVDHVVIPAGTLVRFPTAAVVPDDRRRVDVTKETQINYVELPARDLDATERFYGDAFGWTFVDYGPEYRAFHDGSFNGGFYHADLASTTATGSALIVLYTDRLEAVRERVLGAGGTILKEIFDFPGGRRFHFADPNGNELAVWSDE